MWNLKKVFKRSDGMSMPMENGGNAMGMMDSGMMKDNMSTSSMAAALTVVELFQSQGCSSCPPTNSNIIQLSQDPNFLVLTYEVTYWDYLGWKDTFGNSSFDRRQREYANTMESTRVYTPQVIVNGAVDGVGNSQKNLQKIIESGRRTSVPTLSVTTSGNDLVIDGSDYHDTAYILLVKYVAAPADVPIPRGENSGRTLPHRNVVKDVSTLATWSKTGNPLRLPLPKKDSGLEYAVLVQAGTGGPIIGACRL